MAIVMRQTRVGGTRHPTPEAPGAGGRVADIPSLDRIGTLTGLFRARIERSPRAIAYRYYDERQQSWSSLTWEEMGRHAAHWQAALAREGLRPGERVAVMLRNCPQWVMADQAALGLGVVIVPLYTNDRADSVAYILNHCGAKLLFIEGDEQWHNLRAVCREMPELRRVVALQPVATADADRRVWHVDEWLTGIVPGAVIQDAAHRHDLATIVYTSGTTGRPKGVMLSHGNILWNARSALDRVTVYPDDVFLSFLPLSHTLERTVGYYLPMMAGATVSYNRSVAVLADDLAAVRPTVLISVPRIFERVLVKIKLQLEERPAVFRSLFNAAVNTGWDRFEYQQGRRAQGPAWWSWKLLDRLVAAGIRARLGGRLRLAVCGGAPLSREVARVFIGLGIPIIHGYGMTEAGPVVSANSLERCDPASVGPPLRDVQVRISAAGELLVKSPGVMRGYWHNPDASAAAIDAQGWLHTGDTARIENGFIYITGRLKEIIVLSNGEKVPHGDMELAIAQDPLFEQVLVVGEGRPYLAALVVIDQGQWARLAGQHGFDPQLTAILEEGPALRLVMSRISRQLHTFPGYAQVRRVAVSAERWTIDNGLLTPTLKLRRHAILERFAAAVRHLYEGH